MSASLRLLGASALVFSGCGLFDDPDVGECTGELAGTPITLSLVGEESEYRLVGGADPRLTMLFTDGVTEASISTGFRGVPASLPLARPQPITLGTASGWVDWWSESALRPRSATVTLTESTTTRMRGDFSYELEGGDRLACHFDLRRSERSSSGDGDWD